MWGNREKGINHLLMLNSKGSTLPLDMVLSHFHPLPISQPSPKHQSDLHFTSNNFLGCFPSEILYTFLVSPHQILTTHYNLTELTLLTTVSTVTQVALIIFSILTLSPLTFSIYQSKHLRHISVHHLHVPQCKIQTQMWRKVLQCLLLKMQD
jgi:hypothetical protein